MHGILSGSGPGHIFHRYKVLTMAKESFKVSPTKSREDTIYSEKGPEKVQVRYFKGVDNDGIVVDVTIKGPINIMQNKFVAFPTGKGVDLKMILATSQQTLTGKLAQATTEADEDLEKLEKELEKATA